MAPPLSEWPPGLVSLAAALLSALATLAAIGYGRRRGLLDLPGQRRSHAQPTPRGGGIGIVLAMLAAIPQLGGGAAAVPAATLAAALALVAGIGWYDDHRPLGAGLRLGVHGLAALLLVLAVWPPTSAAVGWAWPLALLFVVGMVNAWNFMDGINGIASSQAAIIAAALVGPGMQHGQPALALCALVLAAACLGFLPFNLPRARIFLGDVGSGALGLLLAALLLLAWQRGVLPLASLLILPSAFLVDAGMTLAMRVLAGKRWYRPHREHLYQWLVRSGWSHLRVTLGYAAWSLVAAFLATASATLGEAFGVALLGIVYASGVAVWYVARRALVAARRAGRVR